LEGDVGETSYKGRLEEARDCDEYYGMCILFGRGGILSTLVHGMYLCTKGVEHVL